MIKASWHGGIRFDLRPENCCDSFDFNLQLCTSVGDPQWQGQQFDTSVKPVQPLVAHTKQAPMGRRPVSPATHNHRTVAGKAHTDHRQGALSNFKAHTKQPSRAGHSKGAGQGANQGAGGGGGGGSGSER